MTVTRQPGYAARQKPATKRAETRICSGHLSCHTQRCRASDGDIPCSVARPGPSRSVIAQPSLDGRRAQPVETAHGSCTPFPQRLRQTDAGAVDPCLQLRCRNLEDGCSLGCRNVLDLAEQERRSVQVVELIKGSEKLY